MATAAKLRRAVQWCMILVKFEDPNRPSPSGLGRPVVIEIWTLNGSLLGGILLTEFR